nr:ORF3 [Anelloviridae sp.]
MYNTNMMPIFLFTLSTPATGDGEDSLQMLPANTTKPPKQEWHPQPPPRPIGSELRYMLETLPLSTKKLSIPGTSKEKKYSNTNGHNSLQYLLNTLYMKLSTQGENQQKQSPCSKKTKNYGPQKKRKRGRRTSKSSSDDSSDAFSTSESDF